MLVAHNSIVKQLETIQRTIFIWYSVPTGDTRF